MLVVRSIVVVFLGLVGLLAFNYVQVGPPQGTAPSADLSIFKNFDKKVAAGHLQRLISIESTTLADPKLFLEIHEELKKLYPKVHQTLKREIVSEYSLVYEWAGSDADGNKNAIGVYSHIDVVPVLPEEVANWTVPAFSGKLHEDNYIYGRGSLDVKGTTVAFMEAVEKLIESNFKPKKTIFLIIGHDEETGGYDGAMKVKERLKARGVHFEAFLDEGGVVMNDPPLCPGRQVALIGLSEKGCADLRLTVEEEGGYHSSMPRLQTAIGVLANAVAKLESNQFPPKLESMLLTGQFLLGDMPPPLKLGMANAHVLKWPLTKYLERNPKLNAMIRTTTAPTMMHGSESRNVLPVAPWVNVNFRIMPGESVKSVVDRVVQLIDDKRIQVALRNDSTEPSPITRVDTPQWQHLYNAIKQAMPDVLVAPFLMIGRTDSVHFVEMSSNIFRFTPFRVTDKDLNGIHGINEKLHLDAFYDAIVFYFQFLRNNAA